MEPAATLEALSSDLVAGRTTARRLLEVCFERIDEPGGQGAVAFVSSDRAQARAFADQVDLARAEGAPLSHWAGVPIAIKDLFDVAGEPNRAGSTVLGDVPSAQDATVIARLRRAGFILVGRTNMSEFAYSGLGLNPHYGDPISPWRRDLRHASGGSTSGGAVAVADGMASVALGTDTGGSCRIPAAFCGLVGFKPTASRVSTRGVIPLSPSLDSVGSIGRSVRCCAAVDSVLTGTALVPLQSPVRGLRLAALQTLVLDDMETPVVRAYEAALRTLADAGASILSTVTPAIHDVAALNAQGGFSALESFRWHRARIADQAAAYDPRVLRRIRLGEGKSDDDHARLAAERRVLIDHFTDRLAGFDAILLPTVPILPPRLSELEDDASFTRINALALRNSSLVNLLDGCAVTLPIGAPEEGPVGLTIAALNGQDGQLLAIAAAAEAVLAAARNAVIEGTPP